MANCEFCNTKLQDRICAKSGCIAYAYSNIKGFSFIELTGVITLKLGIIEILVITNTSSEELHKQYKIKFRGNKKNYICF